MRCDPCKECGEETEYHHGVYWHVSNWRGPMIRERVHCLERQLAVAKEKLSLMDAAMGRKE